MSPKSWQLGCRILCAGLLFAVPLVFGTSSGCKQEEGDRCDRNSDCGSGTTCCDVDSPYEGTCRSKCKPCRDGVLDPGEACDDGNDDNNDDCNNDCSSNNQCGNGIVDDQLRDPRIPEQCDPPASEVLCKDLNFEVGTAICGDDCQLDLSNCVAGCGNGILEPEAGRGEECDGADLGGLTCVGLGFAGGQLSCGVGCEIDLVGCTGGCGNGIIDSAMGEQCDATNLSGETCESLGFDGGSLSCGEVTCLFDTSGCTGRGVTDLNVDTSLYASVDGGNTGASDLLAASCQPNAGAEAVYRVTVDVSDLYLVVTEPTGGASALADTVVSVWDQPAGDANERACNDNDGVGRLSALLIDLDAASSGVYVAVESFGASEGSFRLVIRGVADAGTCSAPVAISGSGSYGVRINALGDANAQSGTCTGAASSEAVFVYTMQAAGNLTVEAESIGDLPFGVYLRTVACDGGSAVEQDCAQGSFMSAAVTATGLSAGQDVYVVVEGNSEDVEVPVMLWITEVP